jgi:hypothetical protein
MRLRLLPLPLFFLLRLQALVRFELHHLPAIKLKELIPTISLLIIAEAGDLGNPSDSGERGL